MANINVDIEKMRESGKDLQNLSIEFISLINDFYNRINKIPTITKEWIGPTASNYVKVCLAEKENYLKYGNSLKQLGGVLVDYSYKLDDRVKSTEEDLDD